MMTPLVISNVVGWLLAAFLLALLVGAIRCNRDWQRLHEKDREKIDELDRARLVGVQADPDGLKWYREENERLSLKCHAICAQIRKMKGRGRGTCQVDRQHHF